MQGGFCAERVSYEPYRSGMIRDFYKQKYRERSNSIMDYSFFVLGIWLDTWMDFPINLSIKQP